MQLDEAAPFRALRELDDAPAMTVLPDIARASVFPPKTVKTGFEPLKRLSRTSEWGRNRELCGTTSFRKKSLP